MLSYNLQVYSTTIFLFCQTEKSGLSPHEVITCFKDEFWNEITPGEYNRLVTLLVETVTIWEDKMEVVLRTESIKSMMETIVNDQD